MKRGDRLAAEREYGQPRRFAHIAQQEPSLRTLAERAKRAARMRRRGEAWRRLWLVVQMTVVFAALCLVTALLVWRALAWLLGDPA